jgi:hypothetical protein
MDMFRPVGTTSSLSDSSNYQQQNNVAALIKKQIMCQLESEPIFE